MSNRDNFSVAVKTKIAKRASYRCSLCKRPTVGPSDSSPEAVASIGDAAHISAASPGGPRYDAAMSSAERSGIGNAIWLCAADARLIDSDVAGYPTARLLDMKAKHELDMARELVRTAVGAPAYQPDIISIGPDIIFFGEVVRVAADHWTLVARHFVLGDINDLFKFTEAFDQTAEGQRYVTVNSRGDGREISTAPTIRKDGAIYLLECEIRPRAARISAHDLPRDHALKGGDLFLDEGNIATVSGIDALPQKIRTCLSHLPHESPFHPEFGSRISQFYRLFADTPWFKEFLKLELIRLAAIPYADPIQRISYTPLMCVERVRDVGIRQNYPDGRWLPISVELDVKGVVGVWHGEMAAMVSGIPVVPRSPTKGRRSREAPARFTTHDDPHGVTLSGLKRFSRERQLEYMEAWFRQNFAGPEQEMPISEGEFVYIWGGPYDATDELGQMFGDVVDFEVIEELVKDLEREAVDWAPTSRNQDVSEEDFDDPLPPGMEKMVRKFEEGMKLSYGTGDEWRHRDEIVAGIERIEKLLRSREQSAVPPGAMGHNNPPEPMMVETEEIGSLANELRKEIESGTPDPMAVAERALSLKAATDRMKQEARKLVETAKQEGRKAIVVAVAGAAYGIAKHADDILAAVSHWLHALANTF